MGCAYWLAQVTTLPKLAAIQGHKDPLLFEGFTNEDNAMLTHCVSPGRGWVRAAHGCISTVLVMAASFLFASGNQALGQGPPTFVSRPVRPYVLNADLRTLPSAGLSIPKGGEGVRKDGGAAPTVPSAAQAPDPLVHNTSGPGVLTTTPAEFSTPKPSFDGLNGGGNPPDTNGAVGPNHFIQMINTGGAGTGGAVFAIWDKTGAIQPPGSIGIQTLWTAAGAPLTDDCRVRGRGDPYVIYDHLADRWVLSELANKTTDAGNPLNIQCIAVSKGPNPVTDGWYAYTFDLGVSNDYPKLGLWPDGYYLITQEGYDCCNLDATVFDRANMLNGNPATFQRKSFKVGGHAIIAPPSELEGPPPPAGSPNFYVAPVDGGLFGGSDRLEFFEFHVDWGVPVNTTFTSVGSLPTAAFSSDVGSGNALNSNDIDQPGTGSQLDAATVWPRTPLHYRNFGDHESLVLAHTVNASGGPDNIAGTRWYEMRRTPPGSGAWSIYQQGTFAPADSNSPTPVLSIHRWMASIAMDKVGNIALGYSVSNDGVAPHPTVFPGLRYAGRLASDPLGELPFGEVVLANGTTSKSGGGRWGDYSAMRVDPVDGCRFWFTSQYQSDDGSGGSVQNTRVGAFRFPTCNPANLAITKSDFPDPVIAGNQLTYTINVTNNGPANATNVVVTDTLPAGVTFLSTSAVCTAGTVQTGCNIGNLANGATTAFTIQVRVPANFLSSLSVSTKDITNTVTVSADQLDPDLSDNTATASTTVIESADVQITKTCKADSSVPVPGTGFCDIVVTNVGVSNAQNVVVTDTLTSQSPFTLGALPAGCTAVPPVGPATSYIITCNLGTLAAGASVTLHIPVTSGSVGGDINDVARVSSSTPDPDTSNNQATGRVMFTSSANLSVTKSSSPNPVVAGTNLTYTITASNAGPSPATNVVVTDTLPGQISVVLVTPGGGFQCSGGIPGNPAQPLICTLGTLASGGSAIITVLVKVNASTPDGTILINNAAIGSDTFDPDNSNNVVTANAPVVARADLAITKTSDQPNYKPNALISFTVGVTNNGPSDALAVVVTDTLPTVAQAIYQSDTGGCTKAGGVLTCNMGNMPVGTSKSFNVYMIVKGNRGTITNNVSVASSTTDPAGGNNTASKSVGVK